MEHEFLNKYRNAKWEDVSGWELSTRYDFLMKFISTCLVVRQLVLVNFMIRKNTRILQRSYRVSVGRMASESRKNKYFFYQEFLMFPSYIIADERLTFCAASSKRQNLDSQHFCNILAESLLEISDLFE